MSDLSVASSTSEPHLTRDVLMMSPTMMTSPEYMTPPEESSPFSQCLTSWLEARYPQITRAAPGDASCDPSCDTRRSSRHQGGEDEPDKLPAAAVSRHAQTVSSGLVRETPIEVKTTTASTQTQEVEIIISGMSKLIENSNLSPGRIVSCF